MLQNVVKSLCVKLLNTSGIFLRCGRLCWITVTLAASETCLWTGRAKTSGGWPRPRERWGWSPRARETRPNSACPTPVSTTASAGRAGIATFATARGRATWDAPVREVRMTWRREGAEEQDILRRSFSNLEMNAQLTTEMSKLAYYSHHPATFCKQFIICHDAEYS